MRLVLLAGLVLAMYLGAPGWAVVVWLWLGLAAGTFEAALRDPQRVGGVGAWVVVALTWPLWVPYLFLERALRAGLRRLD